MLSGIISRLEEVEHSGAEPDGVYAGFRTRCRLVRRCALFSALVLAQLGREAELGMAVRGLYEVPEVVPVDVRTRASAARALFVDGLKKAHLPVTWWIANLSLFFSNPSLSGLARSRRDPPELIMCRKTCWAGVHASGEGVVNVHISAGVRFDRFVLDRSAGGLFRLNGCGDPVPVSLGSRALDVLFVLAERPGQLVSKQVIMDAVWPNAAVEDNNLTVQISTLRRVLDEGRTQGSCIQTVPGRGYRFVASARRVEDACPLRARYDIPENANGENIIERAVPGQPLTATSRWRFRIAALAGICLVATALLLTAGGRKFWLAGSTDRPPLSIVILPFQNLGNDPKDDYLADGITDDLTTDLAHLSGAFVIAHQSAYTYKGKPVDVRKVGDELGVRYVLEGSVRRIGSVLRVNAQLVSTETGAHLWSDRFDEQISDLAFGQEQIVARMRSELGMNLVETEKARSLRERPTNPEAFDLVLRARSILHLPPTKERQGEALALFEQALLLDPHSVHALASTVFLLMERNGVPGWARADDMERAERLLAQARSIAPGSEEVLNYTVQWLRRMRRYEEAIAVAEELVRRFPNNPAGYFDLAQSKTVAGHAEAAFALQEKAIQLDPRSPWLFNRYRDIGFASLLLGRDEDAIRFLERSISINPDYYGHQWTYRFLAAAYARIGRLTDAHHALRQGDRLFPYDTVRSHWPDESSSTVYAEQVRRLQEGLRLAGERDHADEDADFKVPADGDLHSNFAGPTPIAVPGATTIRSADLTTLLVEARPVVIDTVSYSWGRSIPGAIGLRYSGVGGSYTDAAQERLRGKMHELANGDLSRPIVAVGWNSERFDGCNLALRLIALGYTHVYWYRGGREAWEVNGLPEAELDVQPW
jgi:TolB-like protein/DNA-binding winged helix-turn-helix (wHTH) protein